MELYRKEDAENRDPQLTGEQLEIFLRITDRTFPIPLSDKIDLSEYALKLEQKATICALRDDNGNILSMCAGYTDHVVKEMGYIALVATLPEYQGKNYGKKLVKEFLDIADKKALCAVHVYAVETNRPAMKMYETLGFQRWFPQEETRPEDVHFIYRF